MQLRVLAGYLVCGIGLLLSYFLATGHTLLGLQIVVGIPLGNIAAAVALLVLPMIVLLLSDKERIVWRIAKFGLLLALPWYFVSAALAGNTAFVFASGSSWQFTTWLIYTALLVLLGLVLLLTHLFVSLKTPKYAGRASRL